MKVGRNRRPVPNSRYEGNEKYKIIKGKMAESLGEATQSVLPVMEVEVRYRTRHGNGKTLSVSTRRNTWWNEKRRKWDEGQLKRGRKRNSDRGVGGERLCQYKPPGRLRAVRPSERINLSLARL